MKKSLIVANWKMNPQTLREAKKIFNSLKKGVRNVKNMEIVICPPFTQFSIFNSQFSKNIKLGAQDCFWKQGGAYTGEISPQMLKNLGVKYIIVGHSERKNFLGENDEIINKKIKAVLEINLHPIFCLGETKEEKNKNQTFKVLEKQLREGLKGINKTKINRVILVYEPIWAISTTEKTVDCSVQDALGAILFLRKLISQMFSKKIAQEILVLYGGNVNGKNAKEFLNEKWINGVLVGAASLNAEDFKKIIKSV